MTRQKREPQVFICYAHEDNDSPDRSKRWLDRLRLHLGPLESQRALSIWSDQKIESGTDWQEDIQSTLEAVKAAVLLVSPSFLNSSYIRNSELPVLLHRANQNGVVILPLFLRPCLVKEISFKFPDPVNGPNTLSLASFQGENTIDKPLNGLSETEQDLVLVSVAQRLLKVVQGSFHDSSTHQQYRLKEQRNKDPELNKKALHLTSSPRVRRDNTVGGRRTGTNLTARAYEGIIKNDLGTSFARKGKPYEPINHASLPIQKAIRIFLKRTAPFQIAVLLIWVLASSFLSGFPPTDFGFGLFITGAIAGITSGVIEGFGAKLLFPATKLTINLLQYSLVGLCVGALGWSLLRVFLSSINNNGAHLIGLVSGLVIIALSFFAFYRNQNHSN